ncbi:hypothetical protein P8A18_03905 [Streptomyces castrisilvae]|uniref:Uncharacterized protein n=1 Tax=Streptomyces castrisilvae TaxID=3033811 RepID=A0ABY9HE61_9ACTN|nr:hypothetical protein [Streptomyces sp. Mut1]WLQ32644.1 hypothetical protein P8A18_03905 [Streptomyces sp. Mut1]
MLPLFEEPAVLSAWFPVIIEVLRLLRSARTVPTPVTVMVLVDREPRGGEGKK